MRLKGRMAVVWGVVLGIGGALAVSALPAGAGGGEQCIARLDQAVPGAVGVMQAPGELSKIGRKLVRVAGRCADYGLEADVELRVPEPRGGVSAYDEQSLPAAIASTSWGLDKIRSLQANAAGFRGAGAVGCVIDTGLNDGPEFAGRVAGARRFTGDGPVDDVTDGHGHGTHVSGTTLGSTYGVAPEARLLAAKALSDSGSGNLSSIESAIIWCADNRADAINMSLGGSADSPSMPDAVAYARAKGVVVLAAAGNSGARSPSYPGATEGVVGVMATDQNDRKATFSQTGPWFDISAPGVGICSVGGCWSGTSMATPHGTGEALLLAGAGVKGEAAEARIFAAVVDLGEPGKDESFGYGRIDAYQAVQGAQPGPTPTRTAVPPPTRTPVPGVTPTPPSGGGFVQQLVALQNAERAANGLGPLAEDPRLDLAAGWHSTDMATNDFLDHTGSDGSSPWDRMARAGYAMLSGGENIAAGYRTPAEAVAAWMGSSGHRANILGSFRDIGCGYAERVGSRYGTYWTCDFGTTNGPPPPTLTPTRVAPTVTPTRTRTPGPTVTRIYLPTVTVTRTRPAATLTPRPVTPTAVPGGCVVTATGLSAWGRNYLAAWLMTEDIPYTINSASSMTFGPSSKVACR